MARLLTKENAQAPRRLRGTGKPRSIANGDGPAPIPRGIVAVSTPSRNAFTISKIGKECKQ